MGSLVVVLGMHRSGTSAITRGLRTLGVDLGDSFIPAQDGNNAKGFWEDREINALNIEILDVIGSDWHHLQPVQPEQLKILRQQGFHIRAVDLLRSKCGTGTPFGFKDPRVAKLLPFWRQVFGHGGFDVRYVVALRHPLSVVRSLQKRDGFDAEKCYLLWLVHIIDSILNIDHQPSCVTDYDHLMRAPREELARVGAALNLGVNQAEMEAYVGNFLEAKLRHSEYQLRDLDLDPACPRLVIDIYARMLELAQLPGGGNLASLHADLAGWKSALDLMRIPFAFADRIFNRYDAQLSAASLTKQALADAQDNARRYEYSIKELNETISSLIVDRDAQKNGLMLLQSSMEQLILKHGDEITHVKDLLTERSNRLQDSEVRLRDLDTRLSSLIAERDAYAERSLQLQLGITELRQALDSRAVDFTLEQDRSAALIASQSAHVSQLQQTVDLVKSALCAAQTGFETRVHELNALISEKDLIIGERDTSIQELEQSLNQLAEQHEGAVETGKRLHAELLTQTSAASALSGQVADMETLISTLRADIDALIVDRDSHKNALTELRNTAAAQLQDKEEQIARLHRVLSEYQFLSTRLQSELTAMFRSTSWRLTAPLRRLVIGTSRLVAALSGRRMARAELTAPIAPEALTQPDTTPTHNADTIGRDISLELQPAIDTTIAMDAPAPRMRILLVSYYCPSRAHAGGLRILDIYTLIREKCPDIQLDLYTHHRPAIDWSIDEIRTIFHNVFLSPVESLTPQGLDALRGSALHYDTIDLQFHQSAYQLDAFRRSGARVIFTPMESLSKVLLLKFKAKFQCSTGSRLAGMASAICLASEEIGFCLKADETVCVSRSDAAFLRAVTGSRRIRGIDTGVSRFEFDEALATGFVPHTARERRHNVLYVAYFGSETNVLALRWYLENVHPLVLAQTPDYVLTIVGRGDLSSFEHFRGPNVEFVGEVPAIAPYIRDAGVGIAPALGGSGFRGKVNQYAVLGVPSVVSPIAFKGLAYQDNVNIFIAGTPELFAKRCVQLLTDLTLNDEMGASARSQCLERYSWASKWPTIKKTYGIEERQ